MGGVSGLGTLLSGAYIGLAPGEGDAARAFAGLEEPPPISANVPGREFVLTAPTLGSVSPGAPIYYRGIDIGQVLGYKLNEDARGLDITIFVAEPFHELIRTTSRFWNASGIDLDDRSLRHRRAGRLAAVAAGRRHRDRYAHSAWKAEPSPKLALAFPCTRTSVRWPRPSSPKRSPI